MNEHHYEVIIVGGGLSSLTAAAYLSKAGHEVRILEKNASSGGLIRSFMRDGFVFDTGPRSIENSGIVTPMLRELGIEIELLKSPVSIGIESETIRMESKESIDSYKQMLESLYPASKSEISKIIRIIKKVYKSMDTIYGFENPIFKNFKHDKKYVIKEVLPWIGKFLIAIAHMQRMNLPIESYLETLSSNKSLNDIIDQHFFKHTPTFFALGYFYVYLDYLYPKGGTGTLINKLEESIRNKGGQIQFNTEVVSIIPAQQTVVDSEGHSYSYDTLIWAGDLKYLYSNLNPTGLDSDIINSITIQSDKIKAGRGGDSVFTLFLGVDQPPESFSPLQSAHAFYTPLKQGLGETHRTELQILLDKDKNVSKKEVFSWIKKYCKLTSYEISIPSLRDESLSPEGKTGLIISFLLEYDLMHLVEEKGWYDECKEYIEEEIIKTLNSSLYRGLLDTIDLTFSSSPLSIEKQFGNSEGGITGWTFMQASPAINKLPKIGKAVKTPIPHVLQCGQWAYSPAGIPTAILTGRYAADTIIEKRVRT